MDAPVNVVFSDVDGTIVHYPKEFDSYATILEQDETTAVIEYRDSKEQRKCKLLQSLTGGTAYISEKTLELVEQLRAGGVKFVLITGARSSTFEARRHILPVSDFECFENGGRCVRDGVVDVEWSQDMKTEIGDVRAVTTITPEGLPPIAEREGTLWALYRRMEGDGWSLDARNYLTSFRVDVEKSDGKTAEDFTELSKEFPTLGLATSFNLGKADVYSAKSGKANAATKVLEKLSLPASASIAMFDDDNDLELGGLTGRALLPSITHPNVLKALEFNPGWRTMPSKGFLGTEQALEEILRLAKVGAAEKVAVAV